MSRREQYVLTERATVERLAHIVGSFSAAATALRRADELRDPVFLRTSHSIVVVEASRLAADIQSGDIGVWARPATQEAPESREEA